jgi:tetratricopeptide (TPR) repeat protein
MKIEKLNLVKNLINAEKAIEAKNVFNDIEPQETIEYLFVEGMLEQRFQNWGKALNAYSKVLRLDAENVEAINRIKMIQSILNFWNPEMFNP